MKPIPFLLCSLLFTVAVSLPAPAQSAASPAPAPQAANAYDYFKAGETVAAFSSWFYYKAVYQSFPDKFKDHAALLQKLNVSADIMSSLAAIEHLVEALPFSQGFDKWTPADHSKYQNDLVNLENQLSDGLDKFTANNPQGNFCFWLGKSAFQLGWSVPQDMQGGFVLSDEMGAIKTALTNFNWVAQQDAMIATLTPDAQAAIKTITQIGTAVNDPLGSGVTAADLDKMVAASATLRQLAQDTKLVR